MSDVMPTPAQPGTARLIRFFRIVRHPWRWAIGACFICGTLLLFDDPRFMGNAEGFCWYHGEDGSR